MDFGLGKNSPHTSHYDVYLGVWTNWSRGRVFGSTLTLERQNGDLLIAFVAFFVAFVGTRTWRIACTALHYMCSSQGPQDAVHHQRQAILRNSPNPESGLVSFLELLVAWRETSRATYKRTIQRTVPPLLLAVTCLVGFLVASGFSSRVSTATGTEVLLTGRNCGWLWQKLDLDSEAIFTTLVPFWSQQTASMAAYGKECYSSGASGALDCSTFVQKRLGDSGIANINASCPFGGNICRSSDSNILLDSGFMDSHDDLGINSPQNERFTLRRVLQCAPLRTEGFRSTYNTSEDRSFSIYNYGRPILGRNFTSNRTYEYSNDAVSERLRYNDTGDTATPDYSLG
jgi:hypothetical protein